MLFISKISIVYVYLNMYREINASDYMFWNRKRVTLATFPLQIYNNLPFLFLSNHKAIWIAFSWLACNGVGTEWNLNYFDGIYALCSFSFHSFSHANIKVKFANVNKWYLLKIIKTLHYSDSSSHLVHAFHPSPTPLCYNFQFFPIQYNSNRPTQHKYNTYMSTFLTKLPWSYIYQTKAYAYTVYHTSESWSIHTVFDISLLFNF